MGKLHKLRRAIEQNPEKWRSWKGAWCFHCDSKPEWFPVSGNSYKAFVRKTLKELQEGKPRQ